MPTYIKTGYWDKKAKAPKEWLDLDLLISQHAGAGATSITKTAIDTLISSNGLTPGAYYVISGVDEPLYNGTTIIIQAATTNTLALAGHGVFYNPKYDDINVWNGVTTYAIGASVIWGGVKWTNRTGNTGSAVNKYELSDPDWGTNFFNNPDEYNVAVDVIHYDYAHDLIIRRKDNSGNDVDLSISAYLNFQNSNRFPIKDFQWGSGSQDLSGNGVYGNYIKDSYLECLNFAAFTVSNNTLTANSSIYNNDVRGTGSIFNNTLSGGSEIHSNDLYGSIVNNKLSVNSSIYNIELDTDCSINSCTLDVFSSINNSNLTGNNSQISNNILFNSSLQYFTFYNFSSMMGCNFNTSVLDLTTSGTLTGKTIRYVEAINVVSFSNIASATIIYGDYSKQMFRNSAGAIRMGYYNASNVFIVTAITA